MKIPFVTITISFIMLALYVFFGVASPALIWIRGEQGVSLLTAHFAHTSFEHLLWNVIAFIGLAWIIEQSSRRNLMLAIFYGVIAVDAYLVFAYPLNAYAGLSGALNSVLIVALFTLYHHKTYRHAALITMVISALKIAYELHSNNSIFSSLVWPAVPQAHLAGWCAGIFCIIIIHFTQDESIKTRD